MGNKGVQEWGRGATLAFDSLNSKGITQLDIAPYLYCREVMQNGAEYAFATIFTLVNGAFTV